MATKTRFWNKTKRHEFSDDIKIYVLNRDSYKCAYCGWKAWHVDHVVPASRGGPNIKENAVAVCIRCNGRKRNKYCEKYFTMAFFKLLQGGENLSWLDTADFGVDPTGLVTR